MKKSFSQKPPWYLYDTSPNEDVCSLIKYGKRVLDVGCATGRIAEKLKKEKGCSVVGIEVNKEMAEIAKKRCEKVILQDAEKVIKLDFPNGYFDILLFADVLEHCRNPGEILINLRKYLSKKGYILVSVPNVANWEIRLRLLLGNFDYKGGTILDTGHLKFFTLRSIKDLIKKSGYKVVEVKTRNMKIRMLGKIWKSLFAFGFVLKAVKNDD